MFQFIVYIFSDIKASFSFKIIYFLEKIIKFPIILSNRYLHTNITPIFLIHKDYVLENSDGKFLIKAESGNDYMISVPNESNFRKYFFEIQEGKIFLDIGSHIGKWSILLANKKNIKAYCFEPNPETYRYLVESVKLNNLVNKVTCLNYGVAEKEGEMNFYIHPQSAMSKLVPIEHIGDYDKKSIVKVGIISIDSFIEKNAIDVTKIDLIKIDVEGFEEGVIDGMKNFLLNSSKDLKIICEITSSDKDKIIQKICSYGFGFSAMGEQDFYFSKKI